MLSRILGLIREMIIGSVFGATGMTDAYVSATKIPNFFRKICSPKPPNTTNV